MLRGQAAPARMIVSAHYASVRDRTQPNFRTLKHLIVAGSESPAGPPSQHFSPAKKKKKKKTGGPMPSRVNTCHGRCCLWLYSRLGQGAPKARARATAMSGFRTRGIVGQAILGSLLTMWCFPRQKLFSLYGWVTRWTFPLQWARRMSDGGSVRPRKRVFVVVARRTEAKSGQPSSGTYRTYLSLYWQPRLP